MAVLRRLVEPAQYTSLAFGRRCQEAGVRPSMGSVGDAYDNALCESFFATLECELLDRGASRPRPRRGSRSSTSSRAGTTRTVGTPRSTTSRRCAMNSSTASRRHDPKVRTSPRNRGNSSLPVWPARQPMPQPSSDGLEAAPIPSHLGTLTGVGPTPKVSPQPERAGLSATVVPSCPSCGGPLPPGRRICSARCLASLSRSRRAEPQTARDAEVRRLLEGALRVLDGGRTP